MPHLAADEAERAIKPLPACLYLLFAAHEAYINLSLAKISCNLNLCYCHETNSRILEFLQNNLRNLLLHKLLNLFNTKLAHTKTSQHQSLLISLILVLISSMV